ncbi:hypothetical protein J2Z17_002631 [Rhizobium halophytocola]|uniref:Uncharacterized protein n=1 Tax=Rhizobium halophytocola TaxID=735519 RepID=A0ABS4DZT6_9HYPH|nr:hypothetical protein [Rhizobium halophytocola]
MEGGRGARSCRVENELIRWHLPAPRSTSPAGCPGQGKPRTQLHLRRATGLSKTICPRVGMPSPVRCHLSCGNGPRVPKPLRPPGAYRLRPLPERAHTPHARIRWSQRKPVHACARRHPIRGKPVATPPAGYRVIPRNQRRPRLADNACRCIRGRDRGMIAWGRGRGKIWGEGILNKFFRAMCRQHRWQVQCRRSFFTGAGQGRGDGRRQRLGCENGLGVNPWVNPDDDGMFSA